MATRLYYAVTTPADIQRTVDAAWTSSLVSSSYAPTTWASPGMLVRRTVPGNGPACQATTFGNQAASETSASAHNYCFFQLFSEPLAAQTISGTVKGQIFAYESSLSADACAQMVIRVVSSDGQTVRGTLLAADNSALSNEFSTSLRNIKCPRNGSKALSSVSAQDGDRLCVEVGVRFANVSGTSMEANLYLGQGVNNPGGVPYDLPEDETTLASGATTEPQAWLEFSADLIWSAFYARDFGYSDQNLTEVAVNATVAGDTTPPTFSSFSPAAGAISNTQAIAVTATDGIELENVTVYADFSTKSELVYVNGTVQPGYSVATTATPSGSPTTSIAFSVARDGKWPADFTLRLVATDASGNSASTSADYTLSSSANPSISAFSPANGAISYDSAITLAASDTIGLSKVKVWAVYSDRVELIFSATPQTVTEELFDPYSANSTLTCSTTALSGAVQHDVGFHDAFDLYVEVVDTDGNVATSSASYTVTGTAPTVGSFTPAAGAIAYDDTVSGSTTCPLGGNDTTIVAHFNDAEYGQVYEVVYENGAFVIPYNTLSSMNTGVSIPAINTFEVGRTDGWPGAFTLRVHVADAHGNTATGSAAYTISGTNPAAPDTTAPTVTLVSPAENTDLAPTQAIVVDVTDTVELAYHILYAVYSSGRVEVVYDASDSTLSTGYAVTVSNITDGKRYSIRKSPRWLQAPRIVVKAVDGRGNVA